MNPKTRKSDPRNLSRSERIRGILLKKTKFGEGHAVFTLLCEERGKVGFSAFGYAKEKSRKRSSLLTGNLVSALLYRKDAQSGASLKEVQLEDEFSGLHENLKKQAWAFLILESLDRMLAEENPFPLFDLLLATLKRIENFGREEKYALYFLFTALRFEGFFPEFSSEFFGELHQITGGNGTLGDGTLRFLKDSEEVTEVSFYDKREISLSVQSELLELFSKVMRHHFHRELSSLSILPKNIRRSD